MKNLILHSDQVSGKTQIDEASIKLFTSKSPKIAYIPAKSDIQRKYFNQKAAWYRQFGINDFLYFDIDQEYNEEKIPELLSCDAIFLSGGNTYYFLNSLKNRDFIKVINSFVEKGGILIGVSAGSILMSKTIAVTSIDDDIGGDENLVNLKDLSALGLNNFEFFPHFDKSNKEILKRLRGYSKRNESVIYACNDGDGIIISNNNMQFFGEVLKIENGEITTV